MKKSLIALAALATVGAAQAQSSVTVYGIVDAGYVSSKNESSATANVTKNLVQGGTLSTNRLGFRGTEDLGGGRTANFVLEAGLGALNAQSGNNAFFSESQSSGNRTTTVSITDRQLGTIGAGWGMVATHTTRLIADPSAGANMPGNLAVAVGIPGTVGANVGTGVTAQNSASSNSSLTNADYSARANQIAYQSPRINGLQFTIGTAVNDIRNQGTSVDTTGTSNAMSYTVNYQAGKTEAAATFSDGKAKTGIVGAESKRQSTSLVGKYNFGPATLAALYWEDTVEGNGAAGKAADVENKGVQIGLTVPMGKTSLIATYADGTYRLGDAATNAKRDQKGMQVGALYNLSKRTTAYAMYGSQERQNTARTFDAKDTAVAFGLRHSF